MSMLKTWTCLILVVFGTVQAESNYAKKCEDVIGVPVPEVDCSSPGGSEVPVGKVQKGLCDNPSHGLSKCNPGTRFIKYQDTFTRNGKTESVVTFIMCRKTNEDAKRGVSGSEIYSDIGVIQYNETKHATCWFSKTQDGQKPTKTIDGRKVYPSPSTETKPYFWGDQQPDSKCIHCHESGVWLRSPFASGVRAESGKGFKRTDRTGKYQPGDGNNIPENNEWVAQRGLSCSVGLPDWSKSSHADTPKPIKIDAVAYDKKFPLDPKNTGVRSSGTCTECHYLGDGPNRFGCGTIVNELRTGVHPLRRPNAPFAKHFWMPPDEEDLGTVEKYVERFGRALDAVVWCCDEKNFKDADFNTICRNRFSGSGEEGKRLRAMNKSGAIADPCALCSDCQSETTTHRRRGNH